MRKLSKSDTLDKEQESREVQTLRRLANNESQHFTPGTFVVRHGQRFQVRGYHRDWVTLDAVVDENNEPYSVLIRNPYFIQRWGR